jgi:hypothetical protein
MRIRIVREAGGLGDLVRIFSVCQGLKLKYPGCELHFYGLDHYRALFRRGGPCPHVAEYFALPFTVTFRRPRLAPLDSCKWPYLDRGVDYDLEYDMFCPAYCWGEVDTDGDVVEDRGRIWCRAADVGFTYPVWHVADRDLERAATWLARKGLNPDRLIVMQPFGTSIWRNWPKERWREFSRAMMDAGYQVLVLDVCLRGHDLPGVIEWRLPFAQLGAIIKLARLVVSGDSGLFHVAGAIGTQTLGLFGLTSGRLMCAGYPDGVTHFIQGENLDAVEALRVEEPMHWAGCQPPCYARKRRGWNAQCQTQGCLLLNAVAVSSVVGQVREILARPPAPRPRPALGLSGCVRVRP